MILLAIGSFLIGSAFGMIVTLCIANRAMREQKAHCERWRRLTLQSVNLWREEQAKLRDESDWWKSN